MRFACVLLGLLALALAGCGDQDSGSPPPVEPQSRPTAQAPEPARPDAGNGLSSATSNLSAKVSGLGSRIEGTQRILELPADVLFDFDEAALKAEALDTLRNAASIIRDAPQGAIEVIGHTDAKGLDAHNDDLSLRRAQAVRDWLQEQVGVRQRAMSVTGRGERDPIAPNTTADGKDDPAGRALNRRVDISLPN